LSTVGLLGAACGAPGSQKPRSAAMSLLVQKATATKGCTPTCSQRKELQLKLQRQSLILRASLILEPVAVKTEAGHLSYEALCLT